MPRDAQHAAPFRAERAPRPEAPARRQRRLDSLVAGKLTTTQRALLVFANASRCGVDRTCQRVAAAEPYLPIAPPVLPSATSPNPCVDVGGGAAAKCLPFVHAISGWHMFTDEALGFLWRTEALTTRSTSCFDDWDDDAGALKWVDGGGGPPKSPARYVVAHCNKLLGWYPAFAGRYTAAWGRAYGPCKTSELERIKREKKGEDYYADAMWKVRRSAWQWWWWWW